MAKDEKQIKFMNKMISLERYKEIIELKNNLKNGYITLDEYKYSLGSKWKKVDKELEKECSVFISKLFGVYFIHAFYTSPTIEVKNKYFKDDKFMKIEFDNINPLKYEYDEYEKIMNKCFKLLDEYELIKKLINEELIKNYKEKGKLALEVIEFLSEIENNINKYIINKGNYINLKHLHEYINIESIIKNIVPFIRFTVFRKKIRLDLWYEFTFLKENIRIGYIFVELNSELKIKCINFTSDLLNVIER